MTRARAPTSNRRRFHHLRIDSRVQGSVFLRGLAIVPRYFCIIFASIHVWIALTRLGGYFLGGAPSGEARHNRAEGDPALLQATFIG